VVIILSNGESTGTKRNEEDMMARPVDISDAELLALAERSFLEKGLGATEMKDIAVNAGISRSSLYRHFPSKESLAFKVAQRILQEWMDVWNEPVPAVLTGKDALELILNRMVLSLTKRPCQVRFLDEFDQLFSDAYPPVQEAAEYIKFNGSEKKSVLEEALFRGKEDGTLRLPFSENFTAMLLINTLLGTAQRVIPRDDLLRREQGYGIEYLQKLPQLLVLSLTV
jgi:AcrR family transcriptional regulator